LAQHILKIGFTQYVNGYEVIRFLPRDAMHKHGLCVMRCSSVRPSVRLSVCLSRSWTLSKRINISSKCFHRRVATTC